MTEEERGINLKELLDYEMRGSWWASYISNPYLQSLVASYFAWKTSRKYNRYKRSKEFQKRLKAIL